MTTEMLPTIFLSHGSPMTALENIPAKAFWKTLGARYHDIKAVLCISAHWETARPAVGKVVKPGTIHDFSGFPRELYTMSEYPASGAPEIAARAAGLLTEAGIGCDVDASRRHRPRGLGPVNGHVPGSERAGPTTIHPASPRPGKAPCSRPCHRAATARRRVDTGQRRRRRASRDITASA